LKTQHQMSDIPISDEMINRARKKAAKIGELNNSITRGMGNLIGSIGEEVALYVLSHYYDDIIEANTFDYDIIADGAKIDVKTKSTSVAPLPHYMCSVANYNTSQACDFYAFIRVKKDLTAAWWCGIISKEAFYKDAVFMKKGQLDADNKYIVKADCYNIPISRLHEQIRLC
jgi:hypothetical protein